MSLVPIKHINKIEQLTDDNMHGEALEYIAKITELQEKQSIFKAINTLHNIEGSMPTDLRAYRTRHRDEMFEIIKRDKGHSYFSQIYAAL